jgi:hypothetical protein
MGGPVGSARDKRRAFASRWCMEQGAFDWAVLEGLCERISVL